MFWIICSLRLAAFSAPTVLMISRAWSACSAVSHFFAMLLSMCSSELTRAGLMPAFFRAASTAFWTCSSLVFSIAIFFSF
jgi:hypothetical protein